MMKIKFKNVTKKVISLLCAFVMIFSTVLIADASDNSSSELTGKYMYANELLKVTGIYDGVDSVVGKDAFVRRDVMAYLAARIIGLGDDIYQGYPLFDDVDKKSFAYNSINILANMNIVKGNKDGKFEPTKYITLDEATEIILRLMGYSQVIDVEGSRKISQLVKNHKLHDGIKYAKDKRLQVKYLSVLLYNTLVTEIPQFIYKDDTIGLQYDAHNGETLLSKYFDIYQIEGIISSNAYTSISVDDGNGEEVVQIGNELYRVGETEVSKYVGYYAYAFYCKGEDANTLLCIDVETANTVVTFDSYDAEYEKFKYTTYENNKKKIYTVSKALNLIYNGKVIYYDETKMDPSYGTITLVNNNKDKEFDTIIVNEVKNLVVANYGTVSNTIQSKYDVALSVNLNDYDESMISIHKIDGKPYKLTSLKEWDVLSIIESDDSSIEKKRLDITVSTETVSGTVRSVKMDEGKQIITIDETKYEVVPSFFNNSNYNISLGFTGDFYLDMFGRIAAANGNTNQIKWGYLIKAYKNDEGYDDNFIIKIFTQESNDILKLETAEKFYINDVRFTESDITTRLTPEQVVRYRLDKDGKIKNLYTITIDKNQNGEEIDKKNEGETFVQLASELKVNDQGGAYFFARGFVSNVFVENSDMSIAVDSNTVFLQIYNREAGDNPESNEFYKRMSLSDFVKDTWYVVSAYGIEKDDVVAELVIVRRLSSSSATPGGTYMVVSDIQNGIDKDDNPIDIIIGYDINKNKVSIPTRDMDYKPNEVSYDAVSSFGIEKGDFFAMVLYPDGSLQRAVKIYDCNTGAINTAYNGRAYNTTNFGRSGYAYDINSNFLMISDAQNSLTGRKVINTSSATVLIVDTQARDDIVKVGSISDINTYKRKGQADKVVFYGSNSVAKTVVCYK